MNGTTLHQLCDDIARRGRASFDDLRALRAAFAEADVTRADAADLARLDARLGGDLALGDLLAELVVDAAVYAERPTGRITDEGAAWLAATFGGGACPSGGRVLVEVVRAATSVPQTLVEAAFRASKELPAWHRAPEELRLAG